MRLYALVLLCFGLLCSGCVTGGATFRVVDANTGRPLEGVLAHRFSSRNALLASYADDCDNLRPTKVDGRTSTGLVPMGFGHHVQFVHEGYFPAMVHWVSALRRGDFAISSPWTGDARSSLSCNADSDEVVIPMRRVPPGSVECTKEAGETEAKDQADGWRFKVVDGRTGLPIQGVSTFLELRGGLLAEPTRTTNACGVVSITPPPSKPAIGTLYVVFRKPGFRMSACAISANWKMATALVYGTEKGSAESPSDSVSTVWLRSLTTIPMYNATDSSAPSKENPR